MQSSLLTWPLRYGSVIEKLYKVVDGSLSTMWQRATRLTLDISVIWLTREVVPLEDYEMFC